jgi:hypothetical protein
MAGYAIQVRLDGVRPRLTALSGEPHGAPTSGWHPPGGEPLPFDVPTVAEGRSPTSADRWERLHEVWAQTTFFLFSGDSWR